MIRHGRVRLLRDEGASFGKGSTGWFVGFKLHVRIPASGAILVSVSTPGNWPDPAVAPALAEALNGGIAFADVAYRGEARFATLAEDGLLVVTPAAAAKNTRECALISSVHERIETTFSSLWSRFLDWVLSRSWEGLWSTIKRKTLHYNLCRAGILPAS